MSDNAIYDYYLRNSMKNLIFKKFFFDSTEFFIFATLTLSVYLK